MRFLRVVVGFHLTDGKRSEDVKEDVTRIKDDRIEWRECMERMEGEHIPKVIFLYNLADKIDQGRSRKIWKDQGSM